MTLSRLESRKRNAVGEAAILFTVGPQKFAIAASAVDRIEESEGLEPLRHIGHPKLAKVRHTLERDGHRYFVVDANLLFRMLPSRHQRLLLLHPSGRERARVALAVDGIERMLTVSRMQPLPDAFSGEERNWYRALAIVEGRVVPAVNPAAVLTQAEKMVLESTMGSSLATAGEIR